jgi:PAS domain S-box-containing protein
MTETRKRSILIVDDEPLVNQTVSGTLQKYGYATTSAASAQQAMEILRHKDHPELVLMDIDLGEGMDGATAARVIIKELAIPVLFLSGHLEPEFVSRTEDISSYGFVFKDSGETVLLASVKMAFRLFDALVAAQQREGALQASEMRYKSLFNDAPVGYHEIDMNAEILNINETELHMLGYEYKEMVGQKVWKFVVEPESEGAVTAKLVGRLQPGKRYERTMKRKDGSTFSVMCDDVILKDQSGSPIGIRTTIQDNSRTRDTSRRLLETEERYRVLIENAAETIVVIQNGLIKFANVPAEALSGFSRRELLDKPVVDFVLPEDRELVVLNQQHRIDGNITPSTSEQIRIVRKDGATRWVEVRATVISWGGLPATLNFFVDFTDRKIAEDALAKALEEKSELFAELQRRIATSFAMISSLIGLEAERAATPTAAAVLGVLRDRVNSLSRLYFLMDQSGEHQNIRIDVYFTSLVRALKERHLKERPAITVNEHYEPLKVDAKLATPCGIILNELLTNAMRHAFPGDRTGTISVDVASSSTDLIITVSDDGAGPPPDYAIDKTSGVGLRIVRLLVEQFHGSITFSRTTHTTFTATLPR